MLGPCLGEPLSDQLCHFLERGEPDSQEFDKKRDGYIKAHPPEPGGRGLSGLFIDQKHLMQTMAVRLCLKKVDSADP